MFNDFVKKYRLPCALILVFCMLIACFTACTSQKPEEPTDGNAFPIEKIADNLYETTFTDDLDWSDTAAPALTGFSCSAVQNGQYRGRNYDWTYADSDLCIVHVTATENRPHASVGVADMSFIRNEDGSYRYEKLPLVTVDGINDSGVCVQVNVMPYGENGEISHTETTEDDLHGTSVVRYILDFADTVEEAMSLLKEKDIHSEMGTAEELHWMISGPASETDRTTKTVVIEAFPDGLHITEEFVDDKPIMTNFNVSNFNGTPESVGIGFGYERWQILNENFDQASSVMGTFDLMEKVFFTKLYDYYGERFWYSEYNGTDLTRYYDDQTLQKLLGKEAYDAGMEKYGGIYYTAALWDGERALHGDISKVGIISPVIEKVKEIYNAQNEEDGSLWITIHTSVYDLENLTLDIQVRESQDHLHFTIEK